MRAFVAVQLRDEVKESYGHFLVDAKREYPKLRWVRPENLHLTLRFLGETDQAQVERLRRDVLSLTIDQDEFRLVLGIPRGFGSGKAPRTLWLSVDEGSDRLIALAKGVEASARRCRFPAEKRPWVPHLTLARNPKGERIDGWEEFVASSGLPGLSSGVDRITLYSSLLLPQGPVYTEVWTLALGQ